MNSKGGDMMLNLLCLGALVSSAVAQTYLQTDFTPLARPDYSNHPCVRTCNGIPKTCRYDLYAEILYSMEPNCLNCTTTGSPSDCGRYNCIVADGNARLLFTFNRRLPGPTLQVCQGDTLVITVYNLLVEEILTVHWHGFDLKNNNLNDGVPYVTQCPILPGQRYSYAFEATECGTRWYHSHVGFQRVTGLFGHLICKVPNNMNPLLSWYDRDLPEHVISLTEWSSVLPSQYNARYQLMGIFNMFLTSILINGIGVPGRMDVNPRFTVQQGLRYRFRFINAGATVCPMQIKIEGHPLILISLDGNDIVPVTVDTIYINVGERVDVVLAANNRPGLYTLRVEGLIDCAGINGRATIAYAGTTSTTYAPQDTTDGRQFNCINNNPPTAKNCIDYTSLKSIEQAPSSIAAKPNFKYNFKLDTYMYALKPVIGIPGPDPKTAAVINDISFKFPSTPLIQNEAATRTCNWENKKTICSEPICECPHMLTIQQNSIVEFILVDEGRDFNLSHPMHLHGSSFYVVSFGYLSGINTTVEYVASIENSIPRNYNFPVLKDTVTVPSPGYVIIRWIASNPGYWFFHCHVEHHAEEGMDVALKVGIPLKPPADFPRCGDYTPY